MKSALQICAWWPALLLVLTGCGRSDIQVYTVPKEQPGMPLPAEHQHAAAPPHVQWDTPTGWEELPASEFRVASFKITSPTGTQAEVSVIPLPGEAGGDFSNVNRWRGQVGLPPVTTDEFPNLAQPVDIAGQPGVLYEQVGESNSIVAAIQHREGTTWFYKVTGDSQLVPQQKAAFAAFLKSIRFAATATAPAATNAPAGSPQWNPPADWTPAPAGQFLAAKFTIAGGQAAVNISTTPGDGGGVAPNVNRWRRQLGLEPLADTELANSLTEIETGGDRATVSEMNGHDAKSGQPAALVGVIVRQPTQAWFYKLMGDAAVVAAQKEAFLMFVREVKY